MLTKSDLKSLAKLPAKMQEEARLEMVAKNKADREARLANPKVKAFLDGRRARRAQPFSVKANKENTYAVIRIPGFAFPTSLCPAQWRTLKAEVAAIDAVVSKLDERTATTPVAETK